MRAAGCRWSVAREGISTTCALTLARARTHPHAACTHRCTDTSPPPVYKTADFGACIRLQIKSCVTRKRHCIVHFLYFRVCMGLQIKRCVTWTAVLDTGEGRYAIAHTRARTRVACFHCHSACPHQSRRQRAHIALVRGHAAPRLCICIWRSSS